MNEPNKLITEKEYTMKKITRIFIFAAGLVFWLACSQREHIEYEPKAETGSLQLNMGIKVTTTETQPASRAVGTDDFTVSVYDVATGSVAQDVNKQDAVYRYADMPEIITLYTGNYYVVASSASEMPAAEWESPFYQGTSDTISIKKAAVSTIDPIECTQKNVKVTVSYTDNLKKELSDFYATISLSNSSSDYLTFNKTTSQAGYFKPEKLKAVLNGTRYDGEVVSTLVEIAEVRSGQHQHIEFDVILTGHLQLAVNINTDVDIIDKDIVVPPGDSTIVDPNPGEDEPVTPTPENTIAIVGQDFDIDQAIEFAVGETKTVVVDITAPNQIYDLWVEIDSPFLTEEELNSLALPIPKKFNLGNLTSELKEAFGPDGLGLIGNEEVRGKTSLVFDITRFTSLLLQAGTHKFIITVSDYDGYELTKTLTLVNH